MLIIHSHSDTEGKAQRCLKVKQFSLESHSIIFLKILFTLIQLFLHFIHFPTMFCQGDVLEGVMWAWAGAPHPQRSRWAN